MYCNNKTLNLLEEITAQKLREIALQHGILPEQGEKWKTIAKKLAKVTSEKFPQRQNKGLNELIDEVIPERKYFKHIAAIDNIVSQRFPTREFHGYVRDDGKVFMDNIGNRSSVKPMTIPKENYYLYHKHPFSTATPSVQDFKSQKDMLERTKLNKLSGIVFNNDTAGAGFAKYSTHQTPDGNIKQGVDYFYRLYPENYNLKGLFKLPENHPFKENLKYFKDKVFGSETLNIMNPNNKFPVRVQGDMQKFLPIKYLLRSREKYSYNPRIRTPYKKFYAQQVKNIADNKIDTLKLFRNMINQSKK